MAFVALHKLARAEMKITLKTGNANKKGKPILTKDPDKEIIGYFFMQIRSRERACNR